MNKIFKILTGFVLSLLLFTVVFAADSTHVFVDGHVFDTTDETDTSSTLAYGQFSYNSFSILASVAVSGLPTSLQIELEFSDDDTTYYKLNEGSLASLTYGTTSANEMYHLENIHAPYMRVITTSSGCDGDSTYTFTLKGLFKK